MRLWSLHPKYLDAKGLLALWREALLAQKVLLGETKGYRNHPQLTRFKALDEPVAGLASYLAAVCEEAGRRGYRFDSAKIAPARFNGKMLVSEGQLAFEWQHLLHKLKTRDLVRFAELEQLAMPVPHPLFQVVAGQVEPWEKVA